MPQITNESSSYARSEKLGLVQISQFDFVWYNDIKWFAIFIKKLSNSQLYAIDTDNKENIGIKIEWIVGKCVAINADHYNTTDQ